MLKNGVEKFNLIGNYHIITSIKVKFIQKSIYQVLKINNQYFCPTFCHKLYEHQLIECRNEKVFTDFGPSPKSG